MKKNQNWILPLILIIATFTAYHKIFNAGFITSWDDAEYILQNKDIISFSLENMVHWFTRYYIGNYHPLTMLSYALDFTIAKQTPFLYHLVNLLLHSTNAVLLYLLLLKIFHRHIPAFFVALLFALHPVQTESVSWIAERKNVLYGFFYLFSLFTYVRYINKKETILLVIAVLLGLAAMLSKAAAIALPLTLLAIDIWMHRDIKSKKIWLEKLPLLIIAVIIGIIGIQAQQQGTFLNLHPEYSWVDRIIFAGYAYSAYIFRLFVPINLSVLYPYPPSIGVIHYIGLFAAIAIITVMVISYRKKWYLLSGSLFFYTVNIFLVLQFVQFGEVLMADRYLYIPSIAIFIPVVYYLFDWFIKRRQQSTQQADSTSSQTASDTKRAVLPLVITSAVALILLLLTNIRNTIWLSEINFWTAIAETYPNAAVAQYSLGAAYLKEQDYVSAETYINSAVQLAPNNYKAWYNKAILNLRQNKNKSALEAINNCLQINPYPKAYFTRALIYQESGQIQLALNDANATLQYEPQNARALYIKADCLEQQNNLAEAIVNYTAAIQHEDTEPLFFKRRGVAYAKTKQFNLALDDLNTAIDLNQSVGEYWYWRAMIKYNSHQNPCSDLHEAVNRNFSEARSALAKICK